MSAKTIWKGPDRLRRFLVPIESLEPWPGNPRTGDIETIRASLARFGQTRPIVIHGLRIVAGHNVTTAAERDGWTKIAAVDNEFASEDEARAYLLADNRSSDLGAYDHQLLADQLAAYAVSDLPWDGTGYDDAEYEAVIAELRKTGDSPVTRRGQREHRDPGMKDVVLSYNGSAFSDFENWFGIIARELGLTDSSLSEVVLAAGRKLALTLNSGE